MLRILGFALLGAVIGFNLGPVFFDESGPSAVGWFFAFAGGGAVLFPLVDALVRRGRNRRSSNTPSDRS